jgi:hypothetical protein
MRFPLGLRLVFVMLAALAVGGCSRILQASPEPTPMDFPSMAGELARQGIVIGQYASGDDGCHDSTLTATAIGFDASGPGVTTPIRLRVYIFADGAAFDRRRADVDACAAKWATDPGTMEFVDASPFVLVGQGPWPEAFKSALRAAMTAAAGNGG